MHPNHLVYVGVGANLGDAQATVLQAVHQLAKLKGTTQCTAAGLYRSAPVEASGPDFVNTVVRLHTHLGALALLDALQAMELDYGRQRPYRNAPRTLDLDVLLYDNEVICTPRLQVPHPRMHERAFVLMPLAELAPQLQLKQGNVATLARALSMQQKVTPLNLKGPCVR